MEGEQEEFLRTWFVYYLERMYAEGGSGNFVVADAAGYFVQMAGGRGEADGVLEAVSSAYLPAPLAPASVAALNALGLVQEDAEANFAIPIRIDSAGARQEAAGLAVRALGAYGVSLDEVGFEEYLGD